jgi:hypothetical protein
MKFDSSRFWTEYIEQFGHAPHETEKKGTETLLSLISSDDNLQRLEWAAYILGTIRNECGSDMQPVREIKARPGTLVWEKYQKNYWNTGFYGRGYSQLTLKGNYQQFSRLLYGDDRLVKNPDLVMSAEVGYKILATGCVQGLFRRRSATSAFKLSDFLNDKVKDYVGARQIVNGVGGPAYKWALRVGDYSESYEACLRASRV